MGTWGVKMKLFSLFAVFSAAAASNVEIWDEYGNVAYVDYEERGNANFGPPAKGPRECDGKKIPEVKRGKFICKALKKNKAKDGNSKGSKKKKCKFVCDDGWKVQWTKQGKASKKARDGKIKCIAGDGWVSKPKSLKCVKE